MIDLTARVAIVTVAGGGLGREQGRQELAHAGYTRSDVVKS